MNDLEIMIRAKEYMEKLANGIDPLTGQPVKDDDIVNNVRISRSLFYVAGVLQKVIDNGGEVQKEKLKKSARADFALTDEQAMALKPQPEKLFISKVVGIINAQIDEYKMKKLQSGTVNNWLMQKGLITEVIINGKSHKNPTSEGELIGITLHSYMTPNGILVKNCVYSPEAQQFIFDNIDSIIAFIVEEKASESDITASDQ